RLPRRHRRGPIEAGLGSMPIPRGAPGSDLGNWALLPWRPDRSRRLSKMRSMANVNGTGPRGLFGGQVSHVEGFRGDRSEVKVIEGLAYEDGRTRPSTPQASLGQGLAAIFLENPLLVRGTRCPIRCTYGFLWNRSPRPGSLGVLSEAFRSSTSRNGR